MGRQLIVLAVLAVAFWAAAPLIMRDRPPAVNAPGAGASQVEQRARAVPRVDGAENAYVADINLHTVEELDRLFDRVEQLLDRPRSVQDPPLVALVLHGPEVEFFALDNYPHYRALVDRAAKLAAVDISICQTQMRQLGIEDDQVPAFLRRVPYGPGEVGRLLENGYVYM
jgi:hypothetical protein